MKTLIWFCWVFKIKLEFIYFFTPYKKKKKIKKKKKLEEEAKNYAKLRNCIHNQII